MRKGLFTLVLLVLGLYLALHLILGSSPVQRRVVDGLRQFLTKVGLDLEIESIEFSAFTPKIYLNRVTVRARPNAQIPLSQPLAIDKIKIEFQPLALIYRKLVLEEVILFHPVIVHDSADRFYRKVMALLNSSELKRGGGSGFEIVVKKAGVVDALIDIASREPAFAVRTQSFTALVANMANEQQTITLETRNLQAEHAKLKMLIHKADVDVDIAKRSLRVNRAIVESDDLHLNVKGVSSLPSKSKDWMHSINASYDLRIALRLLSLLPELAAPELTGTLESEGTVSVTAGNVAGSGQVKYEGLSVDGYRIGHGRFAYGVERKLATLTDISLHYGGGELHGSGLTIDLKDRFPIAGELAMRDIKLESILDAVKQENTPVRMTTQGKLTVSGFLAYPLDISGDLDNTIHRLIILNENRKGVTKENTVISVDEGKLDGRMTFSTERMVYKATIGILDGIFEGEGFLSFDHYVKLKVKGTGLSLTKLGQIADVSLGGRTNLAADIEVQGPDPKIAGVFDATGGEIQKIWLGDVKGQIFFQNGLLAFENLETPSLDPINGNGFVDFTPKHSHYRFEVEARRADINQVFNCFQKTRLDFSPPSGGEVGARMTIEGGHDDKGIELTASGQAKNFTWYRERWLTSNFSLRYRTQGFELNRMTLLKKSGAVEVKGKFGDRSSTLSFQSQGLLVGEMDYLAKAPLAGELAGDLELQMTPKQGVTGGHGKLSLTKTTFRGLPLPDSAVQVTPAESGLRIVARIAGQRLNGLFFRSGARTGSDELALNFIEFDFSPFVALFLGKDLPSLTDLVATGEASIKGDFGNWKSLGGSGEVSKLNVGLKGTPMRIREGRDETIKMRVERGNLHVDRFTLVGLDSQIAVDFDYRPEESVKGSLDGKLDLQFLQPFIPGLDYGTGKVTAGLRLSGNPARYELFGNVTLDDGTFRLSGLTDEFRGVQVQLSVSQDRVNLDHFEASVNGGTLSVEGDVRINKFKALIPNLRLSADRVMLKTGNYLTTRLSGDFFIRGTGAPYLLGGKCRILEATLSRFDINETPKAIDESPVLSFDVNCDANNGLFVKTDIMDAEMKGNIHMVGNTSKVGLLGNAEVIQGTILFRETKFNLSSGNVKFESPVKVAPRFNMAGRATVKEQKTSNPVEYEVTLLVFGVPEDYKIRLTSSPALAEADIISLLLLGITSRTQEGNYLDMGTAVVGQIPLQSKLQNDLGVDIKIRQRPVTPAGASPLSGVSPVGPSTTTAADPTAASVQIQKDITKKTKLSYSSTLDANQIREYKIEQMLDENFTVNASRVDNPHGATSSATTSQNPSYGLDIRYRFEFE